ncbi:MAG: NUDIX domain-containing protein [bacterium]
MQSKNVKIKEVLDTSSTKEEQIDVLDKEGNFTGIKKSKSKIHKSGDWHRSAHIWLMNSKKELLIQRRSPLKVNYPNFWDISAAGHISAGENSKIGAIREIEEELGLGILPEELQFLGSFHEQDILNNGAYIDNEIDDVYLICRDVEINQLVIQKEEVDEVKWISYLDLEKDIQKNTNKYVDHSEQYRALFNKLKMI